MSEILINYNYLIAGFVAFLGMTVGSFLNVVIDRLPERQTIVKGRSHCDFCSRTLKWWEMIPVFSYLILRGRCRTCHKNLSVQYPAVEAFVGLVTVLYFFKFVSPTLSSFLLYREFFDLTVWVFALRVLYSLVYWLGLYIVLISLVAIAVIDIKKGIIPDEIVIFGLLVYAVRTIVILVLGALVVTDLNILQEGQAYFQHFISSQIFYPILYGFIMAVAFYLLIVITRGRGMGGGDVKLAFLIGLFLIPSNFFLAIYLAFIFGGMAALGLVVTRKRRFGQTVPFGPFLVLGTMLSLFYGDHLMRLYLGWLV